MNGEKVKGVIESECRNGINVIEKEGWSVFLTNEMLLKAPFIRKTGQKDDISILVDQGL